jgi:hypothetical protein
VGTGGHFLGIKLSGHTAKQFLQPAQMVKGDQSYSETPLYVIPAKGKKGKDIFVTGRGGPQVCENSRLLHYLDKRLTDGGKVVSPTLRSPFTPLFFLRFLILISVRG